MQEAVKVQDFLFLVRGKCHWTTGQVRIEFINDNAYNIFIRIAELLQREGLRRGLRAETIKTYTFTIEKFLRICHKEPHQITKQDTEQYIIQLIKWNRSGSTINVHLHALKFFYENVLGKRLLVNVPPIKVRKRLPEFLEQKEMNVFFNAVTNSKHKLLLLFTYGSGFRVSEVVKLKVKDINLLAGHGWIRDGKGGKDRMFLIPDCLKQEIMEWMKNNNLQENDWLFPGYKHEHYSESSVRKIVEIARKKAGILKKISPHSLRHSFATHILENGYSLIEVKELLGHSRLETTMVYTHLAKPKLINVQSPLDGLMSHENKTP